MRPFTLLLFCAPLACTQTAPNLVVAAAADLAPLEAPISLQVRDQIGIRLRFALGSSGMLARQIENGAPYDVYLSANEKFVTDLVEQRRVVKSSVCVYAEGQLGLWSKDGKIQYLNQLTDTRLRHIAIPNPAHAPYGAAAREALTRMGLWKKLEGRIVYAENVRQAFEFASSGNAEAVITAWTMLYNRGGVPIDPSWHTPLRQTGAVVATSKQAAAARRLLEFLTSARGQALLVSHGLFAPAAGCAKIGEPR